MNAVPNCLGFREGFLLPWLIAGPLPDLGERLEIPGQGGNGVRAWFAGAIEPFAVVLDRLLQAGQRFIETALADMELCLDFAPFSQSDDRAGADPRRSSGPQNIRTG